MKFKQIAVVETPNCISAHRVYAVTEEGNIVFQDVQYKDISGSISLHDLDEDGWERPS
jgi:hypothetical protein